MSIQSNTQQTSLFENRYLATYRGVSFVVLLNQQIEKDEFWSNQLKTISFTPNLSFPLNRTFMILNSTYTNIESLFCSDCLNNVASIYHCFGNNQQHYVESILDFFKDTIPKNIPVPLLNEMSYKCFYYVPENHNWKVPFSSFRRNTKISLFGQEFKDSQSEYVRKFFFQSNYDLLFLEDYQEQTLNLIQTVSNQLKQILQPQKKETETSLPSSTNFLSSSPPTTSSSFQTSSVFGSSTPLSSSGTTLGSPNTNSTSLGSNGLGSGLSGNGLSSNGLGGNGLGSTSIGSSTNNGSNIFGNTFQTSTTPSSTFGSSTIFGSSTFGSPSTFGSSTFGNNSSNNRFSNIFSK
jgi:hypothetical protein